MPKKALEETWKKIADSSYTLSWNGKVVAHVWAGFDKLWRGATINDKSYFGPFYAEKDAREAVITNLMELKRKGGAHG